MKRRATPDEDALHIACADWLRWAWPAHLPFYHCPNGGKREQITVVRRGRRVTFSPEARKLQRMGVKPGVPDFCFVMPNGQAAFIELKVGDNDLSRDQQDFRDQVRALGCGWAVVWTFEDFVATCTRWLAAYGLKPRAQPLASAPLLENT